MRRFSRPGGGGPLLWQVAALMGREGDATPFTAVTVEDISTQLHKCVRPAFSLRAPSPALSPAHCMPASHLSASSPAAGAQHCRIARPASGLDPAVLKPVIKRGGSFRLLDDDTKQAKRQPEVAVCASANANRSPPLVNPADR